MLKFNPHTSRKCPVNLIPKPVESTPTQSLAQKTPKLKSVVQRVPASKHYQDPPFKALKESPIDFVNYLMELSAAKPMTWKSDA